jgi:hypothetical protein
MYSFRTKKCPKFSLRKFLRAGDHFPYGFLDTFQQGLDLQKILRIADRIRNVGKFMLPIDLEIIAGVTDVCMDIEDRLQKNLTCKFVFD